MKSFKLALLLAKNHFKQFQRKWHTLPLLLLSPAFLIALLALLAIQIMSSAGNTPIEVGFADLDDTPETRMILNVMKNQDQFRRVMHIHPIQEHEAEEKLRSNQLDAYIRFPADFTEKLYDGEPVILDIAGNPNSKIKARLVQVYVQSAARHINSSQASILAIGHYASQLGLSAEEKRELLREQFKSFLLFTMSKDQAITEQKVINQATGSPAHYYSLSAWFLALTIWLFLGYRFFRTEESKALKKRMALYGVGDLQQMCASLFSAFLFAAIAALAVFPLMAHLSGIQGIQADLGASGTVLAVTLLYSLVLLSVLALIEFLLSSARLQLIIQLAVMFLLVMASGAVIPDIYFPEALQTAVQQLFSNQAFASLEQQLLSEGGHSDFSNLTASLVLAWGLLYALSRWKERGDL